MNQKRKILVTSALPYANGHLHLGHLVEYIQTDIWVRFQKMRKHECYYVCADDAHGTPIMIRAQQQNVSPEQLIDEMNHYHQKDFSGFHIGFDHYHSTHSIENKQLSELFYQRLKNNDMIAVREIEQAYDPQMNMFLPDRFIKGQCPKCHAEEQHGDSCEACGATYSPTDLISPQSTLSGSAPVTKLSEHLFYKLPEMTNFLKTWLDGPHVQQSVAHKLSEWFESGLKEWDITRDAPYFGFEIPDRKSQYFYVWLDAPIGYIASFKALCEKQKTVDFDEFWASDSQAELYHFIGKDIIYFHALFWPAMLKNAGFRLPTGIFAHGFLTVDGKKMSKSKGTFIQVKSYLKHLDPNYLRYYFAAKLNQHIEDIDLNLKDFTQRVNSDLVGKLVNIASRCSGFITRHFDGKLSDKLSEPGLYREFISMENTIAQHFEKREYSSAIREVMLLADKANQYIDAHQPWKLIKDSTNNDQVRDICSVGLNLFRVLITYLKPIIPQVAQKSESFLNVEPLSWDSIKNPLLNHTINSFSPLLKRVENEKVQAMLNEEKKEQTAVNKNVVLEEDASYIDIKDFTKIDLRIAKIVKAEQVEEADKLLQLTLELESEQKTVFAGIKQAYNPEDLIGKLVVFVANLKPRKMRFGLSEGMVLAAGPGGDELWLISPHEGAKPGMKVK